MIDEQVSSLLALPQPLDEATAASLLASLTHTWAATMGAEPSDLESDLRASSRWFNPVAQGQRLRRELSALPELDETAAELGPPIAFVVSRRKRLVTPEGRCLIDLLQRRPADSIRLVNELDLVPYDRMLAALYRDWSRHRLRTVVELLSGSTKPLQIPAAGVVIALLVNRCTSEERALTRFSSGKAREVVDAAFFAPVQAFADVLAPAHRGNRSDPRLVSGWMLYEARRRLGDGLRVVDARNGLDGRVWIARGAESEVIASVARDLARGHRARATPERFGAAYDALVATLRHELPRLAGFGLVYEQPPNTQRLRDHLLHSLQEQLGARP